MELNNIYNEKCQHTIEKMEDKTIDIVLTSPFYNTNDKAGKMRTLKNTKLSNDKYYPYVRYDTFVDSMTDEEYEDFTCNLFDSFDRVVKNNGIVLWQISYGSKGGQKLLDLMSVIGKKTAWTCADIITWKKSTAMPNSCSPNKCTRITEYVFVFCRKTEFYTFQSGKTVVSVRADGQKQYSCFYNYVEAKNNDGSNNLNKATFSSELVEKLLGFYAKEGMTVYDPFMGTGTTAVVCVRKGMNYLGSEISEAQCKYAEERIAKENKC